MSHYRKEYAIGAGGMGKVYRATRTIAGSNKQMAVACKIIRPRMQDRERYAEMFQREAALTIGMRHPGVIEVFECIEAADGTLYLMMELVEGVSIGELIDSADGDEANPGNQTSRSRCGRLTFDMIRIIAANVLAALVYVHDCRVLHRDISPDNVLIARDGTVKLADFGVAKELTTDALQSDVYVGKIAYQAPEAKKGARIDGRADLFSFAAMLYELLAGTPPFGSNLMEIMARRLDCKIAPLPATVPDDLNTLVMGLLAKEPDERIAQTAKEALDLLPAPAERVAVLAELGAMAEDKYRAKCARAETHRRKQELQCEAVPDVIDDARPVVDGWTDTPVHAADEKDRPVGPDGYRTDEAQKTSKKREQGGIEPNGSRWIVHRQRLAVAALALLAIAVVLSLIWNGDARRTTRSLSTLGPKSPIAELESTPTDNDGIAHLRASSPEETSEHAESLDRVESPEHTGVPEQSQPILSTSIKFDGRASKFSEGQLPPSRARGTGAAPAPRRRRRPWDERWARPTPTARGRGFRPTADAGHLRGSDSIILRAHECRSTHHFRCSCTPIPARPESPESKPEPASTALDALGSLSRFSQVLDVRTPDHSASWFSRHNLQTQARSQQP